MVHGRFQPFHNGHCSYLVGAASRSRRLLVGITNPDPTRVREESDDPERHTPTANPFTYIERLLMIDGVVRELGLEIPVHIVPFPIHEPEIWNSYLPAETVHFMRRFSAWGEAKEQRFRAAGFEVVVLDEGAAKGVSGKDVRSLMRIGGDWESLVPFSVAQMIRSIRPDGALDRHPAA
jgi:nicotinamide-nucleotide adenylyltransferase